MNLNRLSGGFYLNRRLAIPGNHLGFNSNFDFMTLYLSALSCRACTYQPRLHLPVVLASLVLSTPPTFASRSCIEKKIYRVKWLAVAN